jgi:ribA/ribD-fused uncharacterized protein
MRITDKFVLFWSSAFSQWHPSPFIIEGITYNCAEQYMMAEKARLFGDDGTLAMILSAVDPSDQKRYGRMVKGFDEEKWNAVARNIVYNASYAKFSQNSDLKKYLYDTKGKILVEASPQDKIWGIGLHWKDRLCDDPKNWKGSNWLGECLTKARDDMMRSEGLI